MRGAETFMAEKDQGAMKARYLIYFQKCQAEYNDDSQPEKLKPDIAGRLENLIELGIITNSEEVSFLIESLGFVKNVDRSKSRAKEDIDKINRILARLIEILS